MSRFNVMLRSFAVGALVASPAMAATVSFYSPFSGVDNTTGWSTDGNYVNLGTSSFTILGGAAIVTGTQDSLPNNITQTGTRGLGLDDPNIPFVEADEVDVFAGLEAITIDFNGVGHQINSIELRSLFGTNNTDYTNRVIGAETAYVDFYLGGNPIPFHTEPITGTELLGSTNGVATVTFGVPYVADLLVFRTALLPPLPLDTPIEEADLAYFHDFAVAAIDVTAVPEPASLSLLGLGGLLLLRRRRRA